MKKIQNTYSLEEFVSAVVRYEHNVLKADFISETNHHSIYLFKGNLRKKYAIITMHKMPWIELDNWLGFIHTELSKNIDYSDTIDVYCANAISFNKRTDMQTRSQISFQLNLNIYEQSILKDLSDFNELFHKKQDNLSHEKDQITKVLFDYLSASQQTQDIKDGLFHTLILFEIFEKKQISLDDLKKKIESKFGRKVESVELSINHLKRQGKVLSMPNNSDVLTLSKEERNKIDESHHEANESEKKFMGRFDEIMNRYGIIKTTGILNLLTKMVGLSYDWDFDHVNGNFQIANRDKSDRLESEFQNEIEKQLNDDKQQAKAVMDELSELCNRNNYLVKLCAGAAFIKLFQLNNYEDYVNSKTNIIVFDTPVFTNYLCVKAKHTIEYETWDDNNFDSTLGLVNMIDSVKDKITVCIPFDYLNEAVGELIKALRLSWFEQFPNIPVPMETANVFFNYYRHIKERKAVQGEDVKSYKFSNFMKEVGFPNTDLEDPRFFGETIDYLCSFAKGLGCEVVPKFNLQNELFDNVKKDYIWKLNQLAKRGKTDKAINCDVRQAFYLTEKSKNALAENKDYYFCTWDVSIRDLRDILKRAYDLTWSYAVCKPSVLINRISLKTFHVSNEYITNELFTYADRNYGVSGKVQRLFDDILCPFFGALSNKDSALVISILKMSKADVDEAGDGMDSSRNSTLPFENIFNSILVNLSKCGCSHQNLRDFIEDTEHEKFIITTFETAYNKYKLESIIPIEIISEFCLKVQEYADSKDKDVKLA